MLIKLILICTLIYFIYSEPSSETIRKEKPNILADYVKFIYENFTKLDHGYVGIVINDKKTFTVDKAMQYIHKNQLNPIFLINFNDLTSAEQELQKTQTKKYYFGSLKMIIVFLELNGNSMTLVLKNLQAMPIYRRRCKLLLIVDEYIQIERLKELFEFLWKKQFLNVAVAYNLRDKFLQVYTYNPFLEDDKKLQNFTDVRFEQNIFYNKLKNINKHKLTCIILKDDDVIKVSPRQKNVTNYKITGNDPEIIENLVNYMNGTVDFVNVVDLLNRGVRNPWRYTNVVEVDALQRKRDLIKENHIDILNSDEMVLNDDLSGITESLYPHDKDDLVFTLRKGRKIPYYKYLFMIFNVATWFTLIITLFLIIGFSAVINNVLKISWLTNYFNLFRPVICSSVPKLSNKNSERIFLIFWFLYCFIIAMAFQSILTSILMEPKYYPDITTLRKLDESDLTITIFRTAFIDMKKSLNGTLRYGLVNKMRDMDSKYDNVNYRDNIFTLEVFDHPIVLAYQRAVFVTRYSLFCKNGQQVLNIIPESPMPRYLAFQVAAGSPYLTALDEALTKFIETGHLIHWQRKWEHVYVIKHIIIPRHYKNKKSDNKYIKMNIKHLYSAFIILVSGQLISLFVFIIEVCNKPICTRSYERK